MQAKMCVDAAQMKGQLTMLKEQVFVLQMEGKCTRGVKVEKKLKGMKDIELEIMKMMRRTKELQLEKRELAIKLVAAQARITALSNRTESKIIAEMEKEMSSLSLANENLTKQAERLQKYRFGMIEELVYQRWLNTCLRIELQSYKNPTPKDLKR
ncbi:hypothetical protein F0562_023560 [Nyssa sinensis]|uniref:Uncharacterized protein n=1 Tax=Nyssa sinensis TaxID=561372 RepID=A0A5J5BHZ3_9ASTE|nr:hypothetical protein F0562_023560 [Nyssa sinensis]